MLCSKQLELSRHPWWYTLANDPLVYKSYLPSALLSRQRKQSLQRSKRLRPGKFEWHGGRRHELLKSWIESEELKNERRRPRLQNWFVAAVCALPWLELTIVIERRARFDGGYPLC